MEDKLIERTTKQSLSFIEQLQNQIQLCREALSDNLIPLTPKVQALESLLWAKLKDDKEYNETMQELNKNLQERKNKLKENNKVTEWNFDKYFTPYIRAKSKEQFKAIMIFIDKKGYMPIGDY